MKFKIGDHVTHPSFPGSHAVITGFVGIRCGDAENPPMATLAGGITAEVDQLTLVTDPEEEKTCA